MDLILCVLLILLVVVLALAWSGCLSRSVVKGGGEESGLDSLYVPYDEINGAGLDDLETEEYDFPASNYSFDRTGGSSQYGDNVSSDAQDLAAKVYKSVSSTIKSVGSSKQIETNLRKALGVRSIKISNFVKDKDLMYPKVMEYLIGLVDKTSAKTESELILLANISYAKFLPKTKMTLLKKKSLTGLDKKIEKLMKGDDNYSSLKSDDIDKIVKRLSVSLGSHKRFRGNISKLTVAKLKKRGIQLDDLYARSLIKKEINDMIEKPKIEYKFDIVEPTSEPELRWGDPHMRQIRQLKADLEAERQLRKQERLQHEEAYQLAKRESIQERNEKMIEEERRRDPTTLGYTLAESRPNYVPLPAEADNRKNKYVPIPDFD